MTVSAKTEGRVVNKFLNFYMDTCEEFLNWAESHTGLTDIEIELSSDELIKAMKKGIEELGSS